MACREKAGKDMQGTEPGVARGDRVLAVGLEVAQKPGYPLLGEVADREQLDAAACLACRELKLQYERVAVAADRVGAEAALTG